MLFKNFIGIKIGLKTKTIIFATKLIEIKIKIKKKFLYFK